MQERFPGLGGVKKEKKGACDTQAWRWGIFLGPPDQSIHKRTGNGPGSKVPEMLPNFVDSSL